MNLKDTQSLIDSLIRGAYEELYLSPKPGLVDKYDSGSHSDLTFEIMEKSIFLLKGYLTKLSEAKRADASTDDLKEIGITAEKMMYKECGTNTHKGYIFLSGLALLARENYINFRQGIKCLSNKFFSTTLPPSNGKESRKVYMISGICGESLNGMPSLFDHALPAYKDVFFKTYDDYMAKMMLMAKLMQHVQDTTAYHRCGEDGIQIIKSDGLNLENLILSNLNPKEWLLQRNEYYKSINLTMGGVADMLALGCALKSIEL